MEKLQKPGMIFSGSRFFAGVPGNPPLGPQGSPGPCWPRCEDARKRSFHWSPWTGNPAPDPLIGDSGMSGQLNVRIGNGAFGAPWALGPKGPIEP